MAREIFISYRRSDAQHAAFALHAHLARAFGEVGVVGNGDERQTHLVAQLRGRFETPSR